MQNKIEITITTNERYVFIYVSRDGEDFDGITIPKGMGVVTRKVVIHTLIKSVRQLLADIITKVMRGD